ncbi:MAG: 2-C-methyl-D-erythritol 4-phosphate cytidylyltransferase [Candidatus Zixiibacteriota bacterium]
MAAGKGIRFGGAVPKQFRSINGRPLLSWTIERFEKSSLIDNIVVVVSEEFLLYTNEKIVNPYGFNKISKIVVGGSARQESVRKGLLSLPYSTAFVAIHDGARPIVDPLDIDRVIEKAKTDRAAILVRPVLDTIKRVESDFIITTVDREKLYRAETPQVFQYDLIMSAHEKFIGRANHTDDSAMIEALGFKVKTVIAERPNIKVTTEDDLRIASLFLEKEK